MRLGQIGLSTSFAMVGVPSAALLHRVLAVRVDGGYLPPIDIIECELSIAALWLRLIEPCEALASGRVRLFAGADAMERYRSFLIDSPCRVPPTHRLTNLRPRGL